MFRFENDGSVCYATCGLKGCAQAWVSTLAFLPPAVARSLRTTPATPRLPARGVVMSEIRRLRSRLPEESVSEALASPFRFHISLENLYMLCFKSISSRFNRCSSHHECCIFTGFFFQLPATVFPAKRSPKKLRSHLEMSPPTAF